MMDNKSKELTLTDFIKDDFYAAIYQNASELILILDLDSLEILHCNQRTLEVFGYMREEEFIGTNFLQWTVRNNEGNYEFEQTDKQHHTEFIRLITISGHKFKAKASFKRLDTNFDDTKKMYLCIIYDSSYNRKLNYLLQETQQIARIGVWEYDVMTSKFFCTGIASLLNNTDKDLQITRNEILNSFSSDNRKMLWKALIKTVKEKTHLDIDLQTLLAYPYAQWVRITGRLITRSSRTLKLIGTVQDITAQKFNELQLLTSHQQNAKAKQMAEDMAETKSIFLSNMSHEIRTPLNAIVAIAHLLLHEKPKKEQVKQLETLQFAANNLMRLVNDVLDLSKIEAGKVIFEQVTFKFKELIGNVLKTFEFVIKQNKSLALLCTFANDIPPIIIGDSVRLSQILTNLLNNAVKFTEEGSITLDIDIKSQDDKEITLLFTITDTGIGIAPDRLEAIFEVFTQAESNTTRKYGGSGLGLAITKNLIELQGGKISVDSELGKGTSFSFDIPYKKIKKSVLQADQQDNKQTNIEKIKHDVYILLVEDNEVNQFVAIRFFKQWGVKYDVAASSQEAIDKVKNKTYHIILMDIHLPDKDGFETTKTIRQLGEIYFQSIPIVALTASVMGDVETRMRESGLNDFLIKPFDPIHLYQKIIEYTLKFKNLLTFEPDK
jgi:signal transduction histidine kinase/ActR/RegA family two-component response regulator